MKTSAICMIALLLLCATVNGRPARRFRAKRNAKLTLDFIKSNESVSRFILDVFNSLSNDSIPPLRTQANTIRSLPNIAAVPGCNLFNFSLSGVDQSELPIISDFFLYMIRQKPSKDRLTIEIRKVEQGEDVEDFITSIEIIPHKESGWVQFHLTPYLSQLIPAGTTHAAFRVLIKGPNSEELSCKDSPITFAYARDVDQDKAPYLTLYTYDNRIREVDYNTILKQLENPMPARRRRRRQTTDNNKPIACTLNELKEPSNVIPLPDIPTLQDATIILPTEVDLGICGGGCSGAAPQHEELRHSFLAHHFLSKKNFQLDGKTVKKCCAPVEYKMTTFVFKNAGAEGYVIINMPNMQIAKCDCLDIIDYSNSQT